MSRTAAPTSPPLPPPAVLRTVIAGAFAALAVVAAGNAAAMLVLRARGYGTLPLAAAAAVYAASAAWCAVRVRAGRDADHARALGRPVGAWAASGCTVWLAVACTYRAGPMFWAISAAALAAWSAAGVWVSRRARPNLSWRHTDARRRRAGAAGTPNVVRAGARPTGNVSTTSFAPSGR